MSTINSLATQCVLYTGWAKKSETTLMILRRPKPKNKHYWQTF